MRGSFFYNLMVNFYFSYINRGVLTEVYTKKGENQDEKKMCYDITYSGNAWF